MTDHKINIWKFECKPNLAGVLFLVGRGDWIGRKRGRGGANLHPSHSFPAYCSVCMEREDFFPHHYWPVNFKPGSALYAYLCDKTDIANVNGYSLVYITQLLLKVILEAELFDRRNGAIIIADARLREVLGVRYLHVRYVYCYVRLNEGC